MSEVEGWPAFDGRSIPSQARETIWYAPDGHPIRRIDWTHPDGGRGALLFMPGRGDCYEKHLLALNGWYEAGWQVTAIDWRGQGRSGRLGSDILTGHIDDFAGWLDDFEAFWAQWSVRSDRPRVIVGHSMGGHLALRSVAEHRVEPDALVLIAPMLGLNPGWIPTGALDPLGRVIARLGDRRRPAWKASELPLSLAAARMQLLTHDETHYADESWWYEQRPDLATGPPSWGWIVAAIASIRVLERRGMLEGVDLPVMVMGTRADRLVSWRAILRAVARLPHAELVAFGPEARHEILRESRDVRDRALAAIDQFLDRAVPAASGS